MKRSIKKRLVIKGVNICNIPVYIEPINKVPCVDGYKLQKIEQ